MDIEKVNAMSLNQAKTLEEKGKLREAEKLVAYFILSEIYFQFLKLNISFNNKCVHMFWYQGITF